MPLTNPTTKFDQDGFADVVSDIRKLFLLVKGGSNDLNADSEENNQISDEFKPITVNVCVDGVQKTMKVMGTDPA